MRKCLTKVLPHAESVFFDHASEMISWFGDHLSDVALISLDHDLPLRDNKSEPIDCGTGRQVADFLASMPPTCPIIVHSSNGDCAAGMVFTLKEAGWPCGRVYPHDDAAWVRSDWGRLISRYLLDGWIVD